MTLTAGQSTTFTVNFAPTSAGTFPGTATVTSNASNPSLSIALSGTSVAATGGTLTAVPTTVAVPGNVAVGTSGTATGQLTAASASVTVTGVSVVGSEFVISGLALPGNDCGGVKRHVYREVQPSIERFGVDDSFVCQQRQQCAHRREPDGYGRCGPGLHGGAHVDGERFYGSDRLLHLPRAL